MFTLIPWQDYIKGYLDGDAPRWTPVVNKVESLLKGEDLPAHFKQMSTLASYEEKQEYLMFAIPALDDDLDATHVMYDYIFTCHGL